MRAPGNSKQNAMFATTHVTQDGYTHMCYNERIAFEDRLYTKPVGSDEDPSHPENSEPPPVQRPTTASSKKRSGSKTARRRKERARRHEATRRKAALMVAAKLQELRRESKHSSGDEDPSGPSVFETGNPNSHSEEFERARRKHSPHRPALKTNWGLPHHNSGHKGSHTSRSDTTNSKSKSRHSKTAGSRTAYRPASASPDNRDRRRPRPISASRHRSRTPSLSPLSSPKGEVETPPLFSPIRAAAEKKKAEDKIAREQERKRREEICNPRNTKMYVFQ